MPLNFVFNEKERTKYNMNFFTTKLQIVASTIVSINSIINEKRKKKQLNQTEIVFDLAAAYFCAISGRR